ncbi:MAG: WYL domain-containing protein [Firmicutes bacterium]|nr:WYL domain-containing protein [Bacillota bacterium]
MLFSELYSVYYNTVARIIEQAFEPGVTEKELQKCVEQHAFSESILTILPALKSGKWPLLNDDLSPKLEHSPTMPLTVLEQRWLKAIADDPRVRLFGVDFPQLEGIEPLFTREDYKIFDQYQDGDPFEDETYIRNFRLLLSAMKEKRPVRITMRNRHGRDVWVRFYPKGFEYSVKDDKIRVIADGCKFRQFNLGRITSCDYYNGHGPWRETPRKERIRELTLQITDERNALERVMLHFAHFEKQAERLDDTTYLLRMKYYESDETEIVIRVLSFGPCVKVMEPDHFIDLIKERLLAQKSCGLR